MAGRELKRDPAFKRDLFFIDITIRKIFSVKNRRRHHKTRGKMRQTHTAAFTLYTTFFAEENAFQPHAALYYRRVSQRKRTDAGKTSYLADKTIHLPRYTTAVSRERMTREKAKRKARHKTPHQGQRSQLAAKCRKLQEKTTFLRRACAEAAAPRNKKRLSRSFYGGKGAFRHAFQRTARLEMVAKMTGRTPENAYQTA